MALTQQYQQTIHAAKTRMLKALKYANADNDSDTAVRLTRIVVLIDKEEAIYNENQKTSKVNKKGVQRRSL